MPNGVKGFQKGHERLGGRKKGVMTVKTEEIRARFAELLNNKMDSIEDVYESLKKPDEKLKFLIDVARIVLPAQQAIDLSANVENTNITIEEKLKMLSDNITKDAKG